MDLFEPLLEGYNLAIAELAELFDVGHFADRSAPWDRFPGDHYIARAFASPTRGPITLAHAVTIAPLLTFAAAERIEDFWTPETEPERLAIVMDDDCPQCGFPETFAEGPADGPPEVLGCRKCGWRQAVEVAR